MNISILTIFPEMFDGFLNTSIIKKALLQKHATIEVIDIRSFTDDKHNRVDDYPFGGGQGMVLFYQPVVAAIKSVKTNDSKAIMLTPAAYQLNQQRVRTLAKETHLILICGHYEGFDERILEHVDEVLSIGDYILTGGELAAMVVSDAIVRVIDGVITESSHLDESFENGLLEYPQYTRPQEIDGYKVPEVLLSGHHENVRKWRLKESLRKTLKYRPDLLEKRIFSKEEEKFLQEISDEWLKLRSNYFE